MDENRDQDRDHTPSDRIAVAKAAGAPQIYFNGFATALSPTDIILACERNGDPVALINLSLTTAKTLAVALGQTIALLEEKSGRDIMTSDFLVSVARQAYQVESQEEEIE